ncbi:SNARE protein SED5/Syntaxin 5 [Ceraceosorus bombacis]|uniref:SNARE protein SED5/Syntaxin 5 n=1 Tax=Ceraceosorus bombacis TaxID=401625 RepID=A0A0P1BR02_9BASI|nr:SNARE protein SED5/Syntaxin 5 [Ceraceosorus bombacis]
MSSASTARYRDRTHDFLSLVESHTQASGSSSRLLADGGNNRKRTPAERSEFAKKAASVAKEIAETSAKLGRLAELAKRKTLFDDRPVEISELTYIIKHDLASINQQLGQLQSFGKPQRAAPSGKKDKGEEHRGNVVTLLQSRLAGTTSAFQEVLEVRTKNMKASRERTDQFAFNGGAAPAPPQANSKSPLYTPRAGASQSQVAARSAPQQGYDPTQAAYDGYDPKAKGGGEFLTLDMGQQQQQLELMENGGNDAYMQQRSTAIESIESTISELGSIFGQLAHMVQEQGEMVTRIDADVEEVGLNVEGAQRELLKYLHHVSSNRMLMLKIFGAIIITFLLLVALS